MKRVLLLLGLLIMWSVGPDVLVAATDQPSGGPGSRSNETIGGSGGQVLEVSGTSGDGSEGDPGDAGDGLGFDDDRFSLDNQGCDGVDPDFLEILLQLLLQLNLAP
ncbi:MAG: hypothetical protein ABIK96_15455 [bacterium]